MTRGSATASPEPGSGSGQPEEEEQDQADQITVSEEPATMSSSPSSSNHSPGDSPPRAPIALATSPSAARARGQASEGKREENGEGEQQQQQQQQWTSSPPPSSSPVQENGDHAEGESASPVAASPSSERRNSNPPPAAQSNAVAEPSETKSQEARREERPARNQSRQPSREYKETLDATTKDEKDGTRMLNQYHLTRVIGQGAYGVVFEGRLREDPSQIFAVKELSKTRLKKSRRSEQLRRSGAARGGLRGRGLQRGPSRGASSDKEEDKDPLELIRREIAIMKKLDHPNIISLHEVLDDPSRDELYMVVEYCPGGIVIDVKLHERTTPLKEDVARSYFVQILLGIEYLHSSDIVHRDIKPANILLAEGGKTCKIVDFGVSELFAPSEKPADEVSTARGQGTPAFLSPEICSARAPSRESTGERRPSAGEGASPDKPGVKSERETSGYRDDMWAFGVTLYCMVVGHLPFDKSGFMDLYEAICNEEPEYPSHLSQECVDLLQKFLMKDPEKRITIEDAREHQWVTLAGTAPIPSAAKNLSAVVSEITEDELRKAICRVSGVFAVARAVTKFKRRKSTARSTSSSTNGDGGQNSNDRQGSLLWSAASSSNPSSPHVQQGPYDSPLASPSVSRAGTIISSLTGGESGLGLTSAFNSLRGLGFGGGQSGTSDDGRQASLEETKKGTDAADTKTKEPEQPATSLISPLSWARSAGSSSSLRSSIPSLPSAINTAASAGAKTLGLGTIAEVNTPASPESKSGWPLSKGTKGGPAQEKSKDDSDSVDVVASPSEEEEQQGSNSPTKVESPSGEEAGGDPCEIPADRRQSHSERLHASLKALEARLEARMRQSDPTGATKHLSNRLQQAGPLDRLSAGLKGFGLDTISATLAELTGQDRKHTRAKDEDAKKDKEDADQDRPDSDSEENEQRRPSHRPDSLIEPDHLKEDEEGHNVHTGRKTSRGTASSGVKVDRFSEQQEHWARVQARERGDESSSSLLESNERPHLFDGPVVESPVREEVPMDQAVQTLSALIPDGEDDDHDLQEDEKKLVADSGPADMGSSNESGTSGTSKGSGDYFTSSLGPKSKAAAQHRERQRQRQQPQSEGKEGEEGAPPFSADASSGAIDPHSGRIDGDVQVGDGGPMHHIERPAVGELSADEKHAPPVESESESGSGGTGAGAAEGSGGSSKSKPDADPTRSATSPETEKEGADTEPRRDTRLEAQSATQTPQDTCTHSKRAAAGPISTEDSLPASGFGDDDGQGGEGVSRDRKKGGQGAAVL